LVYKYFSITFLSLIFLLGCTQPRYSRTEFVLGTNCTITIFEDRKESVLVEQALINAFDRLREIDNLMSVNLPASDISRINASAGIEPVRVNKDVFNLITNSFICYFYSSGAFNPAIGPIVSLWDIDGSNPRVPLQQEIDAALPLTKFNDIEFDYDTYSIFLKKQGMSLDLGAIAKGYAADETAVILLNAGIKRAIIDLGGNVIVLGQNPRKKPWRVGIQDPNGQPGDYIRIINVTVDQYYTSIVTSGGYQRYFEQDGIRYHHIFSPADGYPVNNELLSVTIISPNSMYADAYSTAVFVLGYEKGLEMVNNMPLTEAVFVFKDGSVRTTNRVELITP